MVLATMLVVCSVGPSHAQSTRETVTMPREFRGRNVQVTGTLLLPPGTAKVPAMVIQHGSGGVTDSREFRYAREMLAMGVAALVVDSFKPRGIVNTVSDQSQISVLDVVDDGFAALRLLADHPRIDAGRVGIVGFSKGGTAAWQTARERRAARLLPTGLRFALHVPMYPGCQDHFLRPRLSGAPILMLLGGADTYAGVAPCTELADKLKAAGGPIEVKIYPGAKHGFDLETDYSVAKGENWSKCIFDEQQDGTWKERLSGLTIEDQQGRRIEPARTSALEKCRTYGVTGGPNPAAKAAALADLKAAVRRHLLEKK